MWSLEWAALTGAQPCTVFSYKDFCGSTVLGSGNERADRLASTADITSGLQLGRAEVLLGLKNFLNMDRPGHHSTDRLKERGVEKEAADIPTCKVENDLCSTRQILALFRRRLLRDRAEQVWAFPSTTMPS